MIFLFDGLKSSTSSMLTSSEQDAQAGQANLVDPMILHRIQLKEREAIGEK